MHDPFVTPIISTQITKHIMGNSASVPKQQQPGRPGRASMATVNEKFDRFKIQTDECDGVLVDYEGI